MSEPNSENDSETVDLLIVGAGPAGLTAGIHALSGGLSIRILEQGSDLADRHESNPSDTVQGIGGAGLYSDGKFSFYPSASALWELPNTTSLRISYSFLANLLATFGASVPAFPDLSHVSSRQIPRDVPAIVTKHYQSLTLEETSRSELTRALSALTSRSTLLRHRLHKLRHTARGFEAIIVTNETNQSQITIRARSVILAVGRFGLANFSELLPRYPSIFRRHEYGVRIEQPEKEFFLKDQKTVDPKIKIAGDHGIEYRTFCCCRKGRVIATRYGNTFSYSGTRDGGPTNRSNVGFNVRISSEDVASRYTTQLHSAINGCIEPFTVTFDEFMHSDRQFYGTELDAFLRQGLSRLSKTFNLDKSVLWGPCIEGVGYYPRITSHLQVESIPLWIAGDATGQFRGLTAALLSGHYASSRAIEYFRQADASGEVASFVKASSTAMMASVFTAQSKNYFYCRDAVCEFVFKSGKMPLNPFRIFDYFLGERIDRNMVRQGNNHLIRLSDELWVFGPVSDGVLFEIVTARRLGKPIRFFTIDARVDRIVELSIDELTFEPEVHSRRVSKEDLLKLVGGGITPSHRLVQDTFEF